LGHTIYYKIEIPRWREFRKFIERVCTGLGCGLELLDDALIIHPFCRSVEPLEIAKRGTGFVKTNLMEPCHSLYLLVLHSASSFGSVELWED